MNVPDGLYYTKEHEWMKVEGSSATVGITDYAQHALGDVVFVDLPAVGKTVTKDGDACAIESSKAASDIYAPVSGTVTEANATVSDNPSLINEDPYGKGWIFKMTLKDKGELAALLNPKAYADLIATEE